MLSRLWLMWGKLWVCLAYDSSDLPHGSVPVIGGMPKDAAAQSLLPSPQTRVLVTHGISFLPQTDFIIVLADGQVSEMGHYSELLQHNGSFANFLRNYAPDEDQKDSEGGKKLVPTNPGLPNAHPSSASALSRVSKYLWCWGPSSGKREPPG